MFQIKDLMVSVLPGRGMFLGQYCRISATDAPKPPGCGPRTAGPRPGRPSPGTPGPPHPPHPVAPDPGCKGSVEASAACGHEKDRGPRRAAELDALRRELRGRLASRA